MSCEIKYPNEVCYYIVYDNNNDTNCQYGRLTSENVMTSGLPNLEEFTDLALWIKRLLDFGITPDPEIYEL